MVVLVEWMALYAPLAKILQIGILFFWDYSFCRFVAFAKTRLST